MKYLIWGTGKRAINFVNKQKLGYFREHEIVAFVDNDKHKEGKSLFGKKIILPSGISSYQYDKILILSTYETEIIHQINCELGINLDIVQRYYEMDEVMYEYYEKKYQLSVKKVLLIGDKESIKLGMQEFMSNHMNIIGFVDSEHMVEIERYSYDYLILVSGFATLKGDKRFENTSIQKKWEKWLIEEGHVNPKKIFYRTVGELYCKSIASVSYGEENSDKTFLLIQIGIISGFCAIIRIVLSGIKYALKRGYIPVVDMMTLPNQYAEEYELGLVNTWEKYFEQPCGYRVQEVMKSKNVKLLTDYVEVGDIMYLFDQYIHEKKELSKKVSKYCQEINFEKNRILGVLFRGTDYANLKPYNHAIQPTLNDMIEKVKEKWKEWGGFDFIYLCTEVQEAVERFELEFGEKVIYYPQERYSENCNEYLSYVTMRNSRYEKGEDYYILIRALAHCNSIIAGSTSGSALACLMNKNQYENSYIFNLGVYGIDDLAMERHI